LRTEESVGGRGLGMQATKALIAGVFGRAAPTYERAGPPFFS
jgi:hypothetical protein